MEKIALVVDDSAAIRKMVSLALKGAGFEVVQAANGKEALENVKGKALAVVVTDLNMPVLNGLELIKELRLDESHRFAPIVFLTTEVDQQVKEDARAAGATAWIQKPFNAEQLVSVIRRLTE